MFTSGDNKLTREQRDIIAKTVKDLGVELPKLQKLPGFEAIKISQYLTPTVRQTLRASVRDITSFMYPYFAFGKLFEESPIIFNKARESKTWDAAKAHMEKQSIFCIPKDYCEAFSLTNNWNFAIQALLRDNVSLYEFICNQPDIENEPTEYDLCLLVYAGANVGFRHLVEKIMVADNCKSSREFEDNPPAPDEYMIDETVILNLLEISLERDNVDAFKFIINEDCIREAGILPDAETIVSAILVADAPHCALAYVDFIATENGTTKESLFGIDVDRIIGSGIDDENELIDSSSSEDEESSSSDDESSDVEADKRKFVQSSGIAETCPAFNAFLSEIREGECPRIQEYFRSF